MPTLPHEIPAPPQPAPPEPLRLSQLRQLLLDPAPVRVELPGLTTPVYVRAGGVLVQLELQDGRSALQTIEGLESVAKEKMTRAQDESLLRAQREYAARTIVALLVDDAGERLFQPGDWEALAHSQPYGRLMRWMSIVTDAAERGEIDRAKS